MTIERKHVRYLCYRLKSQELGLSAAPEKHFGIETEKLKNCIESQFAFDGWKNFASTWDVNRRVMPESDVGYRLPSYYPYRLGKKAVKKNNKYVDISFVAIYDFPIDSLDDLTVVPIQKSLEKEWDERLYNEIAEELPTQNNE